MDKNRLRQKSLCAERDQKSRFIFFIFFIFDKNPGHFRQKSIFVENEKWQESGRRFLSKKIENRKKKFSTKICDKNVDFCRLLKHSIGIGCRPVACWEQYDAINTLTS